MTNDPLLYAIALNILLWRPALQRRLVYRKIEVPANITAYSQLLAKELRDSEIGSFNWQTVYVVLQRRQYPKLQLLKALGKLMDKPVYSFLMMPHGFKESDNYDDGCDAAIFGHRLHSDMAELPPMEEGEDWSTEEHEKSQEWEKK